MISWCGYCQNYIGQSPPLDNFNVSHGICKKCALENKGKLPAVTKKIKKISKFYMDVWRSAKLGESLCSKSLLERAEGLGILQSSFLIGILQPILMDLGHQFTEGKISVATEHKFSKMVTDIISLINDTESSTDSPDVLIMCADGNYHTIGSYFLKFLLEEQGCRVTVISPGLPLKDSLQAVEVIKPRAVAISVSLESQIEYLNSLAESLSGKVAVYVGGPVFQGNYIDTLKTQLSENVRVVEIKQLVAELSKADDSLAS